MTLMDSVNFKEISMELDESRFVAGGDSISIGGAKYFLNCYNYITVDFLEPAVKSLVSAFGYEEIGLGVSSISPYINPRQRGNFHRLLNDSLRLGGDI